MSRDRREEICARLPLIAAALAGIRRAVRNVEDVTGRSGPIVAFWDGDEATQAQAKKLADRMIEMTPETRILVDAGAADVGPLLNGFRLALIKAVTQDADLLAVVGSAGDIRYDGCSTETAKGERIEGGLALNFRFVYPLIGREL